MFDFTFDLDVYVIAFTGGRIFMPLGNVTEKDILVKNIFFINQNANVTYKIYNNDVYIAGDNPNPDTYTHRIRYDNIHNVYKFDGPNGFKFRDW